jgi:hypothetical protein
MILAVFWLPDTNFVGGTAYTSSREVGVTNDPTLYRTERYGTDFFYSIPLPNGNYDINLHLIENAFNGSGERIIDILAEGQLLIDNMDLAAEVGRDVLVVKTLENVQVNDANLDLKFSSGASNAFILGIEVMLSGTGRNTFIAGGFGNNKILGVDPGTINLVKEKLTN